MFAGHAVERHQQRGVRRGRRHLQSLLYLLADVAVDGGEGGAVGLEAVFGVGAPFSAQGVGLGVDGRQFVRLSVPQRVARGVGVEVDVGRIDGHQRQLGLEGDVLVGAHLTRRLDAQRQLGRWHDGVVRLAALLQLILLLLPVLALLLQVLHALGVAHLRQHRQRVGLQTQHARGVGDVVGDGHRQRVLVDQRRVAQPIGDGVALERRLYEEGVVGVEVVHHDAVGLRPLVELVVGGFCHASSCFLRPAIRARFVFKPPRRGRPMVYDSVFRVKFRGFRRFYDLFLRRKYLESPVGVIRRFGVRPRATRAKKFPA